MGLGGGPVVECLLSILENLDLVPIMEKNKNRKGKLGWPFVCGRDSVMGMIYEGQCNRLLHGVVCWDCPMGQKCAGTVLLGQCAGTVLSGQCARTVLWEAGFGTGFTF